MTGWACRTALAMVAGAALAAPAPTTPAVALADRDRLPVGRECAQEQAARCWRVYHEADAAGQYAVLPEARRSIDVWLAYRDCYAYDDRPEGWHPNGVPWAAWARGRDRFYLERLAALRQLVGPAYPRRLPPGLLTDPAVGVYR